MANFKTERTAKLERSSLGSNQEFRVFEPNATPYNRRNGEVESCHRSTRFFASPSGAWVNIHMSEFTQANPGGRVIERTMSETLMEAEARDLLAYLKSVYEPG